MGGPLRQSANRLFRNACVLLHLILWGDLGSGAEPLAAQDILISQLRQGFGKNKVRYEDFEWWVLKGEHMDLFYEPEFHELADRALHYLEEGYDHLSEFFCHQLSSHPPVIIFQSHYQFEQTNIIRDFLPPGVAGFAEPLRYRIVIPFAGDLDEFRNVLVHELAHVFEYDILYGSPLKSLPGRFSAPPTWIMEGLAEYAAGEMSTVAEMVLRDAVLTDQVIPLETMDAYWGMGGVFLAYKQSHSLMEYIAVNYGPEALGRFLRLWDSSTNIGHSQSDTDRLLKRLLNVDMKTLHERWATQLRKRYWPLLQTRDYLFEIAGKVVDNEDPYYSYSNPQWSPGGDMLAVLSTDGVEQHVDIIRRKDGSLVKRVTRHMHAEDYDHLSFGSGTLAWTPDGRFLAFVARKGPRDVVFLWDVYDEEVKKTLSFEDLELLESLAWSPDSQRLAFIGTGHGQSDLYVVDISTGERFQVTSSPQREDHPAWSPEGKRIAYSAKNAGQFDIRIYDLVTGESRVVIQSPVNDLWPNWLPDGDKLLFVSTRADIGDLFVYHLETQREYRLTRTLSGVVNPVLSLDGRQILLSTYYQGRHELYSMDVPDWPTIEQIDAELMARERDRPTTGPVVTAVETQDQEGRATASPVILVETDIPVTQRDGGGKITRSASGLIGHMPRLLPKGEGNAADSGSPLSGGEQAKGLNSIQLKAQFEDLSRQRYRPKLEFEEMAVQMGYVDGFFSSLAQLRMRDLLGNHELVLATDYSSAQESDDNFNFFLSYGYYGKRPSFSGVFFNWEQFFRDDQTLYMQRGQLTSGVVRSRQTGFLLEASYPRDLYRRIEVSYTYIGESREVFWPIRKPQESFDTHLFKAAYVHDSISYGLLGPTSGKRYFLAFGYAPEFTLRGRSFSHVELDYRRYLRLGRWSVLGLRALSAISLGRDGLTYFLGGPAWFEPFYAGYDFNMGPLRGYDFAEFSGSRVVLVNAEARVPFIRRITFGWPITITLPAVDGSFFLDVGGAWNREDELKVWPLHKPGASLMPGEQHLYGDIGFGLLVYFILPMNFEFARQTDLKNFSDYRMHFSLGKSF